MYQPVPQVHEEDFFVPLQSGNMDTTRQRRKRVSTGVDEYNQRRKHRRRTRRSEIPTNVPGSDWREMSEITLLNSMTVSRKRTVSRSQGSLLRPDDIQRTASRTSVDALNDRPRSRTRINQIQSRFKCRECVFVVPSLRNPKKCGCGRTVDDHDTADYQSGASHVDSIQWSIGQNCKLVPTNAFGTIEFEGGPHPLKAQYLRLSFDSDPADIIAHIRKVWKVEPPRLIITVHGGMTNFSLQPKLARVFRKGLVKAAGIPGAWIITSGIDSCTVNHVTEAIYGQSFKFQTKPRHALVGTDKVVSYYRGVRRPDDGLVELNRRHSFFLLVDNGTVGRYGADVFLPPSAGVVHRREADDRHRGASGAGRLRGAGGRPVDHPLGPRLRHQRFAEDGELRDSIRQQLLELIKNVFGYDAKRATTLIAELLKIVKETNLVTIFRLGESAKQELDNAILTALLTGQNLTAIEQLTLALAWDRADVARSDILVMGQDWPKRALYNCMAEALIHNRVDFVRLLLENGVAMKDFLTIARLENLYNSSQGPKNTLPYIVDDVVKGPLETQRKMDGNGTMTTVPTSQGPLDPTVGIVPPLSGNRALSNHLMWRSANRHGFVNRADFLSVPDSIAIDIDDGRVSKRSTNRRASTFDYPFSDLLIWAVLTRRHQMALCMWEHGEEAMAKALIACRLVLANEASEDYLDLDICEEFRRHADEFRELSVSLLDNCYKLDEMRTLELLTYEMQNWGRETNLTLAIIMNNKQFIAHPCCQALLADLWHGGMRIRSNTNLKVIMGLLCWPSLLLIDFKSAEELRRQPQTAAEHADDSDTDRDTDSIGSRSRSSSSSSTSSSSSSSDESTTEANRHLSFNQRRRVSTSSAHSNHFGLFRSRRKRQKSTNVSVPDQQTNSEAKVACKTAIRSCGRRAPRTSRSAGMLANKTAKKAVSKKDLESGLRNQETAAETTFQNKASVKRKKDRYLKQRLPFAKNWKINKDEKIRFQRRIYEFFVAPITTFWSWTLSFAMFLAVFTFVLLVKTPPEPTVLEWGLLACSCPGPKTFREKLEAFFVNYWNALTMIAILMNAGRVVLATNSMLWSVKLLDFLSVHAKFGPYVNMIGKMILSMTSIVVMLGISLLAFGLARQSITYPNEEWNWLLLRNVFYKPYFMLYGEVYADEIDTCGDEAWDQHQEKRVPIDELDGDSNSCVPGYWVPPVLMTVFLLFANILLISMLIAIFNNIFDATNKVAHQIWLFQRYRQVMEYQNISILPPPFTPLYHLHLVVKFFKFRYRMRQDRINQDMSVDAQAADPKKWQRAERRRKQKIRLLREQLFDSTLKLFFNQAQIEKLHDFEGGLRGEFDPREGEETLKALQELNAAIPQVLNSNHAGGFETSTQKSNHLSAAPAPSGRTLFAVRSSMRRAQPRHQYSSICDTIDVDAIAQTDSEPEDLKDPLLLSGSIEFEDPAAHDAAEEEDDEFRDNSDDRSVSIRSLPDAVPQKLPVPLDVDHERRSSFTEEEFEPGPARTLSTPTTTLQRAKGSFIQKQNTIMKGYEEEVDIVEERSDAQEDDQPLSMRRHSLPTASPS
ncbi:Transient receptor potential channel [Aphelenchoides fujianensis]|nr:Transient receptor potential channel [Aphelenchoides fujianensis]